MRTVYVSPQPINYSSFQQHRPMPSMVSMSISPRSLLRTVSLSLKTTTLSLFPSWLRGRSCRCWESLLWVSSLWRYVLVWILNSIRKNDQLAHFRFILQRYQEGLWDCRNSCCMCVHVHSIFTRRSVLANNLVISLMKTERSLLWPILSLPREITFLYSSVVSFYHFLALLLYDSYLPWYSSWEAQGSLLYADMKWW